MNKPVTKAVVLAAGFGTRFLPASKAIAKVMFPVIDKPIIQFVVEELVLAGITDITFVVSSHFPEIKKHFTPFAALNEVLEKNHKTEALAALQKIESMASFHFVEQKQGGPIGTGWALLSAKEIIGNEPFVFSWSDEFFSAEPPRFKQLLDVYEQYGGMVEGCMRTTDPRDGARFGFVKGEMVSDHIMKVSELVEKPGEGKAPSELATMSGKILFPEIFAYLEKAVSEVPAGKDLYYNTYGLQRMLADGFPVYGLEYQNYQFYDTGDKLGYLKTVVDFGLKSPELGEKFRQYLQGLKN